MYYFSIKINIIGSHRKVDLWIITSTVLNSCKFMIFSYCKCDNDSYDMFRMQVIDLARNGKEVSEPNKCTNHDQHKETM